MGKNPFALAKQVGRVPSMTLPLDSDGERRYQRLMEDLVMIDMHQHPMVCPDSMDDFIEYLQLRSVRVGLPGHPSWRLGRRRNRQRLPRHGRLSRTVLHRL